MKSFYASFIAGPVICFVICNVLYAGDLGDNEIAFQSGEFFVTGEIRLPEGAGPFPVVLFVHGDGPNDRSSGGSYPPVMERMQRAGYATFSWDKPGTGESTGKFDNSRLFEQRAGIVLDAIAAIKKHPSIDPERIGLWGISQAGYVMPLVAHRSRDVAFMITVSCPGTSSLEQSAYLLASQARCAGLSPEESREFQRSLEALEKAQTYEQYAENKKRALRHRDLVTQMGFRMGGLKSEDEWEPEDPEGKYFFDPMGFVEQITIPILVFFGERDTQVDPRQGIRAYRAALQRAGNRRFRIELIPGVDHCMMKTETGCLEEVFGRSGAERVDYGEPFLDIIEQWLTDLRLN